MNVLSIEAANFHRYPELAITLPTGCAAIVGPNGAGKSTLLDAIDVALYGARSLADHVTPGETAMHTCITFEHRGSEYRARRAWKNGKATLDLERVMNDMSDSRWEPGGIWEPLTRENVKATQAALEQLLGLTRDTLHASSLLMQGDGAAFTSATPARRKELLCDALGLDIWTTLQSRARDDLRTLDRELAGVQAMVERLIVEVSIRAGLEVEVRETEHAVSQAEAALALAEKALAQVLERYQTARDQAAKRETLEVELAHAQAALAAVLIEQQQAVDAAANLVTARAALELLPAPSDTDALVHRERELLARIAARADAVRVHEFAAREAERQHAERAQLEQRARQAATLAADLRSKAEALRGEHAAVCDRCSQELAGDARAHALANLLEEADTHEREAERHTAAAAAIEIPSVPAAPQDDAPTGELAEVRAQLALVQEAVQQRARLEERVASLETAIDARPQLADTVANARAAADAKQAALDDLEPVDLAVIETEGKQARASVEQQRAIAGRIREQLASLRTKLDHLRAQELELAGLRVRVDEQLARLDLLKLADKAYGPSGIPALILENAAIPQIETEANRIIQRLGRSYRFELRTQRELKSGDGVREALDIVVHTSDGERPYETFSGGEKTRINLALRIALARLIATRRGAEVKLLAIDEPDGLDVEGFTQLADVLVDLERAGEFERILVVSHHPELRHAFENVIEVAGGGDTGQPSRVLQQLEAVAA